MSQEYAGHVVERAVDAINRGDVDAFVGCCHPEVDWEENSSAYLGINLHNRGRTGAREWFQGAILDFWDSWHFTLEEMTEASEGRMLAVGTVTARGKGSGVETTERFWSVLWLRSDLIVRRQVFLDAIDARRVAGLEE